MSDHSAAVLCLNRGCVPLVMLGSATPASVFVSVNPVNVQRMDVKQERWLHLSGNSPYLPPLTLVTSCLKFTGRTFNHGIHRYNTTVVGYCISKVCFVRPPENMFVSARESNILS